MAQLTPDNHDRASRVEAGEFTAAAQSGEWFPIREAANAAIAGSFTGSCRLEISFDGGDTVIPVTDGAGEVRLFAAPERVIVDEIEPGVLLRWHCVARSTGTIAHRISR